MPKARFAVPAEEPLLHAALGSGACCGCREVSRLSSKTRVALISLACAAVFWGSAPRTTSGSLDTATVAAAADRPLPLCAQETTVDRITRRELRQERMLGKEPAAALLQEDLQQGDRYLRFSRRDSTTQESARSVRGRRLAEPMEEEEKEEIDRFLEFVLDARHGDLEELQRDLACIPEGDKAKLVNAQDDRGTSALMMASGNNHTEIVTFLLQQPGIEVNSQNQQGSSALHWAALNGCKSVCEVLLEAGANANAVNFMNKTAFDVAMSREHFEVCEVLAAKTDVSEYFGEGEPTEEAGVVEEEEEDGDAVLGDSSSRRLQAEPDVVRLEDKLGQASDVLLRPLLDVVESVRSDLTIEDIDVPGVVVIGQQSHGKSSILEAITGINFPRGEQTCTRMPCIVRMRGDARLQDEPYALVSTSEDFKDVKRIPVDKIQDEIRRYTKQVAGPKGKVVDTPLHVEVVRNSGPTLTLIDLPGITHVSEQQDNIHDVIVSIVARYVQNPQMLILVAVLAVEDFGNSEALKLARDADPAGVRTIGVATKIDFIKRDSDIVQKLKQQREGDLKLRLGWVAVRCRTPAEVSENLPSAEAHQREKDFFQNDPVLCNLEEEYWGIQTLVDRIVDMQREKVEEWIPNVKSKIAYKLYEKQQQLRYLPVPMINSDRARFVKYMELVAKFQSTLDDTLAGHYSSKLPATVGDAALETLRRHDASLADKSKFLHIPPRIHAFSVQFEGEISMQSANLFDEEFGKHIADELREIKGCPMANFAANSVFLKLFVEDFRKVVPRATTILLLSMHDYITDVLRVIALAIMGEFPRLTSAVQQEVANVLYDQHELAKGHIHVVLESERHVHMSSEDHLREAVDDVKDAVKVYPEYKDASAKKKLPKEKGDNDLNSWYDKKSVRLKYLGLSWEDIETLIKSLEDNGSAVFDMQIVLYMYRRRVHQRIVEVVSQVGYRFLVSRSRDRLIEALQLQAQDAAYLSSHMKQQDSGVARTYEAMDQSIKRLENCLRKLEAVAQDSA